VKRTFLRAIAITMMLTLLAPAGAEAHVKTFRTTVVFAASDTTVSKGDQVRFGARAKAKKKKCRSRRTVKLVRNGTVLAVKRTNRPGYAFFSKKLQKGGKFWVVVTRKRFGAHPHRHICPSMVSKKIRIRVQCRPPRTNWLRSSIPGLTASPTGRTLHIRARGRPIRRVLAFYV